MNLPVRRAPRPLTPGDKVALVAPSGPVSRERLNSECRYLESLGLTVVTRLPRKASRYLSGTDSERASEFLNYWNDPKVAAVFAARGGFGCARIVSQLLGKLRSNSKLFSGFSDNTVIHQVLAQEGIAWTLHAPHPGQFGKPIHKPTQTRFENFLFGKIQSGVSLGKAMPLRAHRNRQKGRLSGGNLAVLASLCGTPLQPDLQGIVFLEDVNEQVYRLDAFMTQLKNSGAFRKVTAFVMGEFSPPKGTERYSRLLRDWFGSVEKDLGIPVYTGFPGGHGNQNLSLPLGAQVDLRDNQMILSKTPWSHK